MAPGGIWKAFQVTFWCEHGWLGYLLRYLVKSLLFNGTIFEQITAKQCPPHLGIPMTWNHLEIMKCLPSWPDHCEMLVTSMQAATEVAVLALCS